MLVELGRLLARCKESLRGLVVRSGSLGFIAGAGVRDYALPQRGRRAGTVTTGQRVPTTEALPFHGRRHPALRAGRRARAGAGLPIPRRRRRRLSLGLPEVQLGIHPLWARCAVWLLGVRGRRPATGNRFAPIVRAP
jgi:enoyl-CoA hydratase/carnithine racemase